MSILENPIVLTAVAFTAFSVVYAAVAVTLARWWPHRRGR
jgi:hypothetical protein